ncbi:hypothetical protein ZHAS_00011634 [Anopheles sinensis]|uniref:Uncharacterized protein n=1 Tax=Anopheles sinensis TaxID=74873 RepID=A0A084W0N3_ANOSI|nr:hypothetical protein ZHAS_00011634 [Anopheles sinensis]
MARNVALLQNHEAVPRQREAAAVGLREAELGLERARREQRNYRARARARQGPAQRGQGQGRRAEQVPENVETAQ